MEKEVAEAARGEAAFAMRMLHLLARADACRPFMSSRLNQHIGCCPDWKILKIHYACGGNDERRRRQFAMYVYLPNERHGLHSMLQNMASNPELVEAGSMDLWSKVRVGDFGVPKFTVSYKTEVTGLLQGLGLRLPFDHQAADFSEMLQSTAADDQEQRFVVSNVFHQSFVEVNEEGTEAAAATAVGFSCTMSPTAAPAPVPLVDFVADHPFMYLIKEELTGAVVFAGQVANPSL